MHNTRTNKELEALANFHFSTLVSPMVVNEEEKFRMIALGILKPETIKVLCASIPLQKHLKQIDSRIYELTNELGYLTERKTEVMTRILNQGN